MIRSAPGLSDPIRSTTRQAGGTGSPQPPPAPSDRGPDPGPELPTVNRTPLKRGAAPVRRTRLTAKPPAPPTAEAAEKAAAGRRAQEAARTARARQRAAQPRAGASTSKPHPRPRARPHPASTGPTATQRQTVTDRDRGLCVRCGQAGTNDHHRTGRGMGGRKGAASIAANSPANRLTLCGSGTTGCHGWATTPEAHGYTRTEVEQTGYVVRRSDRRDPASIPVYTRDGWALFDHDGGRTACRPPAQAAA